MTFCKLLKHGLSFRIPGNSNTLTFNPCCVFGEYIPFHPTVFERKRKLFLEANDFIQGCDSCKLKEVTHGTSLRKGSNAQIPDFEDDRIYKVEIAIDTTCNAACIECGELQSSLWRKEIADQKIIHIQPEVEIDTRIDQIKSFVDFNQVKMIHFWGGEPLLTDTHLKFLRDIKDLSDVSLVYSTNGSVFPDQEVLDIWKKCKQVKVGISLDGIGDRFSYIRWPLSWDKVVRNLERFKTETSDNVQFFINSVILPLNVFYVNELGDWLDQNFHTNKNGTPVPYLFIRGEGIMDAANTPPALRYQVYKTLGADHTVSRVLQELPVIDYTNMVSYLDNLDSTRNNSWRKTFPEISKYFADK